MHGLMREGRRKPVLYSTLFLFPPFPLFLADMFCHQSPVVCDKIRKRHNRLTTEELGWSRLGDNQMVGAAKAISRDRGTDKRQPSSPRKRGSTVQPDVGQSLDWIPACAGMTELLDGLGWQSMEFA